MLCWGEAFYFDVDFTGLLDRFLFYECNHPLEFVGDLFIAEAVRTGHDVDEQSVDCSGCGPRISVQSVQI
jgi:hypothetical protein